MNLSYTTLWEAGYDLPPEIDDWAEPEAQKAVAKGHCRHCGKKIGKGLHFHEKSCKEAK